MEPFRQGFTNPTWQHVFVLIAGARDTFKKAARRGKLGFGKLTALTDGERAFATGFRKACPQADLAPLAQAGSAATAIRPPNPIGEKTRSDRVRREYLVRSQGIQQPRAVRKRPK